MVNGDISTDQAAIREGQARKLAEKGGRRSKSKRSKVADMAPCLDKSARWESPRKLPRSMMEPDVILGDTYKERMSVFNKRKRQCGGKTEDKHKASVGWEEEETMSVAT